MYDFSIRISTTHILDISSLYYYCNVCNKDSRTDDRQGDEENASSAMYSHHTKARHRLRKILVSLNALSGSVSLLIYSHRKIMSQGEKITQRS